MMTSITAYVDGFGDLLTGDTAERIRAATADEKAASHDAGSTGMIETSVATKTLHHQCPKWCRLMDDYRPGWDD